MLSITPIFLTSIITVISNSYIIPNKFEPNLLIQLSDHFNIKHLIIIRTFNKITEINSHSINFLKYLSKNYIFTEYLTAPQARETMHGYVDLKKYHPRTFVLLQEQKGFSFLFYKFNRTERYLSDYIWLAFEDHQKIVRNIKLEYIPYDCEFLSIKKINKTFVLTEIYHGSINSNKIFTRFFGLWEKEKGFDLVESDFYQRRLDLNGTLMEVLENHPKCGSQTLCAYRAMIEDMGRMMNFKCLFKNWKTYRDLREKNITILSEITLEASLFDAFIFYKYMVAPIWKTPAFLHIRYRSQYEEGYTTPYVRPFTTEIWIALFIWTSVTGIFILILNYLLNKYIKVDNYNLVDSAFIAIESCASQCGSKIPKSISSRLSILMSRILPTFISPLYSAVIISFLTVQIVNLPFTNLEGLINDGSFKIAYENETAVQWFFKMARDNLTKLAYEKFVLPPDKLPAHQEEWVEQLCKDRKYAFVYFNNDIYRNRTGLHCKVLQIPTPVFVTWDGFPLRYYSPFRKIFNKILKIFFSAGLLSRTGKLVYGRAPKEKEDQSQEPVKIDRVIELYRFFFCAHLLCIVIFLLEKLNIYFVNKNNKKKKIEMIIKYKQERRRNRLAFRAMAK